MLAAFIDKHQLPEDFGRAVEKNYLPLAKSIFTQFQKNGSPYFVGLNGCQGSGKTTCTDFIGEYLAQEHQLNVVVMSLDDFYLPSAKRKKLAEEVHPLLATRGVPGTHDIEALNNVLTKLANNEVGFSIPKFNKGTDEPCKESTWYKVDKPVDIVLLEGWCWGTMPQTTEQLKLPVNELEFHKDSDAVWRNYVNEQLIEKYQPLYKKMNYWLVLQAPSFDCVYKWRLEQEEKLKARMSNLSEAQSKIMNPEQILNFTQYFQRLSVQGINTLSQSADAVLYLDNNRTITKMVLKG